MRVRDGLGNAEAEPGTTRLAISRRLASVEGPGDTQVVAMLPSAPKEWQLASLSVDRGEKLVDRCDRFGLIELGRVTNSGDRGELHVRGDLLHSRGCRLC